MDMKKILQALDSTASKPVEGSDNMKKFLSVVTEGANPHKVTLPVQMAMQHYAEPRIEQPRQIKEVKKTAMSNMLYQYYNAAEEQLAEQATKEKQIISEQARQLAQRVLAKESRVDELSKTTLQSYKGKAEAQVKELGPHAKDGEYKDLAKNAIERRKKGIEKADKKIAAKEGFGDTVVKAGAVARQAVDKAVSSIPKPFDEKEVANDLKKQQVAKKESYDAEYDDEAGMADNNIETMKRAVDGLDSLIHKRDNLPELCQEKIAVAKSMLVAVWDYMASEEQDVAEGFRGREEWDSNMPGHERYAGMGRGEREDDEYHVPDPVQHTWYLKVNGEILQDSDGLRGFHDKHAAKAHAQQLHNNARDPATGKSPLDIVMTTNPHGG